MPKSKKTKTVKHPGGRPSKFKPEYCQQIIDYFSVQPMRIIDGKPYANELPFLEDFAARIGVAYSTLTRWVDQYPEFCNAYKRAKEMQKAFLIQNGLAGLYNSTFAIFTAKNITDMRDKTDLDVKTEITGQVGCVLIPAGGRYAREQIKAAKEKDTLGAAT